MNALVKYIVGGVPSSNSVPVENQMKLVQITVANG